MSILDHFKENIQDENPIQLEIHDHVSLSHKDI